MARGTRHSRLFTGALSAEIGRLSVTSPQSGVMMPIKSQTWAEKRKNDETCRQHAQRKRGDRKRFEHPAKLIVVPERTSSGFHLFSPSESSTSPDKTTKRKMASNKFQLASATRMVLTVAFLALLRLAETFRCETINTFKKYFNLCAQTGGGILYFTQVVHFSAQQ